MFRCLTLQFVVSVLPAEGVTELHPSSPTTTSGTLPTQVQEVGSANQNQPNRVQLAVGLTLGLLALIAIVLGIVYYLCRRKRRRRTANDQDPHSISPYNVSPMRPGLPLPHAQSPPGAQADEQLYLLPVRERPLKSAQFSGTPTTTVGPSMSPSAMESEAPPSYVA